MSRPIHVIEPTLEDYAGHCYGLVRSFCDTARTLSPVHLWAGTRTKDLDFGPNCEVHAWFKRRLRVPQLFLLFRRLFRDNGARIFVPTAKRGDLLLARLVSQAPLPVGKLYLYFHWFRETPRRIACLRKAAAAQPHITILATTESVAEIFKSAGFNNVLYLPYPLTAAPPGPDDRDTGFRHLLYAGAARQDKGFKYVVDLVELLRDRGMKLPVIIQVSAEHYGKYDEPTREQLRRLERMDYSPIRLIREPLAPQDYADLFQGAICLQPYDREEFRDRVSGVTMDALTRGAPIVATSGSWIARQISPYDAGLTLENLDAENLLAAAETITRSYAGYRNSALTAGMNLQKRSWQPLLSLLQ